MQKTTCFKEDLLDPQHNTYCNDRIQNQQLIAVNCSISYALGLKCNIYWNPGKGKVIADSVITVSLKAFMFATYCLFSMFYPFM